MLVSLKKRNELTNGETKYRNKTEDMDNDNLETHDDKDIESMDDEDEGHYATVHSIRQGNTVKL